MRNHKGIFSSLLLLSVLASAASVLAPSAQAFEGHHIGRIHEEHWRGGRWVHDRHGGRLGWWWVAGPSWFFYPRPIFEVAPRTVVIEQPAPVTVLPPPVVMPATPPAPQVTVADPVLYYCKSTGTYYPETMPCPGGWSPHTAGTPPQ